MGHLKNWVLITGATSGIGYELSKCFAKDGYNLILVGRKKITLQKRKEELEKYSILVETAVCDLTSEESVFTLYEEIKNRGLLVETLVNSAGAGKSGNLIEQSEKTTLDLIHLNVTALTLLTQLFAKDMVKRGHGNILIIASTAAFGPDTGLNVYGPTKAYDYSFAQTLHSELQGTGVHVSCVCPGPTKTNWSKNAGRKDSAWAMEAGVVAQITYNGFKKHKALIIPGTINKLLYVGSILVSDSLIGKITAKFQESLK